MSKFESARLIVVSIAAGVAVAAFGQRMGEPRGAGGGSRPRLVHPRTVPFFAMAKAAGFPVVFADKREFIEMIALTTEATPAAVPGLKKPTPTVQLEYGFKKGGIGDVYEMPLQSGVDARAVFATMIRDKIYHDHDYMKGWAIQSVPHRRLLIAVSGTTPQVRDALVRAIEK